MGFDDDLLESLDDFGGDQFPGGDDDEDLFPEDIEEEGGPSPVFLIAGGLIVATFLVLLVIVFLISSGQGGTPESARRATEIHETNVAVQLIFNATATRLVFDHETATLETERINNGNTQTAIAAEGLTLEAVESTLDATRTEIAAVATGTTIAIQTEIGGTAFSETMTATALTPRPSDTPIPPTIQFIVQDQAGNPIPGGVIIRIYVDTDGDGVFEPAEPTGPTPTAFVTPTSTAQVFASLTPSQTPTFGPTANAQPTIGPTGAGFNTDSNPLLESYIRVQGNPGSANANQEDITQTPTIEVTTVGITPVAGTPTPEGVDVQVATIITNPDGTFTITGLPPGNYFFVFEGQDFPIPVTIPETATFLSIPTDGTPIGIYVIPGVIFPTATSNATATNTPLSGTDIAGTIAANIQETIVAMTISRTPTPTGGTVDATLGLTQTFQAQTDFFQTGTALSAYGTEIAKGLPDTGFFDELGRDASLDGLTFLGLFGSGLAVLIFIVHRLRQYYV